ncbi:MAG TPA: hypothetical protein VFB12_30755 [Ktedonobacteraceae bacterium]|nr:hypothetical protein [Ktedonobacteraceae bacterium]
MLFRPGFTSPKGSFPSEVSLALAARVANPFRLDQVLVVDVMLPKVEKGLAMIWESGPATPGGRIGKAFDFG